MTNASKVMKADLNEDQDSVTSPAISSYVDIDYHKFWTIFFYSSKSIVSTSTFWWIENRFCSEKNWALIVFPFGRTFNVINHQSSPISAPRNRSQKVIHTSCATLCYSLLLILCRLSSITYYSAELWHSIWTIHPLQLVSYVVFKRNS